MSGHQPPALRMSAVVSGYGRSTVLDGIDLEVAPRELVALLGPNGAGKTTVLRTIAGMLDVRAGSVEISGRPLAGLAPHRIARLGVAHVPEGRGIFPGLSLLENLRLGTFAAASSPGRGDDGWLAHSVELFPWMEERLAQRAGTLSGGQQQMLAIARALVSRPQVLLLDEPSTGLSPRIAGEVFDVLARIREAGMTIVLAEQNVRRALALADRGYVLNRGRIMLAGAATELRESAAYDAYMGG